MKFELPALPYGYDALVPYISEETLKVHHDKHHKAYCDKFNAALDEAGIESEDFAEIFAKVSDKPAIRNNGGGFWNHNFYFESMASEGSTELGGELLEAINRDFGDFENFKKKFTEAATTVFGSGWAWLGVNESGKLVIYKTANQDNFMMDVCSNKEKPVLVIDVWEHAYYIDYQNRRPEYIENFFKVINWDKVGERFKGV